MRIVTHPSDKTGTHWVGNNIPGYPSHILIRA